MKAREKIPNKGATANIKGLKSKDKGSKKEMKAKEKTPKAEEGKRAYLDAFKQKHNSTYFFSLLEKYSSAEDTTLRNFFSSMRNEDAEVDKKEKLELQKLKRKYKPKGENFFC